MPMTRIYPDNQVCQVRQRIQIAGDALNEIAAVGPAGRKTADARRARLALDQIERLPLGRSGRNRIGCTQLGWDRLRKQLRIRQEALIFYVGAPPALRREDARERAR